MALSCPLWFATGLFCANIFYWFISRLKVYWKAAAICACVLVSYGMDIFGFPKLPWNLDTALMAVLFLMTGDYLHDNTDFAENLRKRNAFTVCMAAMLAGIGWTGMYFNDIDWVNFMWNSYGNLFFMLLGSVPVILALYGICRILPMENSAAKCIGCAGRHTLFILGFEYTAGRLVRLLIPKAAENWFVLFLGKCILLLAGFGAWTFLIRHIPNDRIRAHFEKY